MLFSTGTIITISFSSLSNLYCVKAFTTSAQYLLDRLLTQPIVPDVLDDHLPEPLLQAMPRPARQDSSGHHQLPHRSATNIKPTIAHHELYDLKVFCFSVIVGITSVSSL